MGIKDASRGEIDYLKRHLSDARSHQEKEFLNKIDIDLYKAYYEGTDFKKEAVSQITSEDSYISLNKVYPATNRVIPTLYWQNPKIMFSPKKGTSDFSAKILTATINYDYKEMRIKQENQQVILDAWYSGFGACKIGYQTAFAYKEPGKAKPDKEEKIIDYIEYEGPFVRRVKPTDIFRDSKQPAGKDRIIWIHYKRSLEDITNSDVYEYDSDFITRFKVKDAREVELDIYEGWIRTQKGLYIVAMCESYTKPIRYELSSWKGDGFPICFLSFADLNDEYYPPSPMKVASKQAKQINYLTTLQFNVVNKFRNQTGINVMALTEEGKKAVDDNKLGGIVKFKVPVGGNMAPISSAPIPADLFNLQQIMQDSLQECLTVSGLRMGSAEGEQTLGQDQIKDFGNQLGLSGMTGKVKDYVIEQAQKLSQMRKQYSTAPSLVPIVGLDLKNPATGQLITDEWLEFGTANNPVTLKQAIAGDYDTDVDIKSAQKPDDALKMKLFENVANILRTPEYQMALTQSGGKIDWIKLTKEWLGVYKEYISNADSFVIEMSDEEKQQMAMQAQQQQQTQQQAQEIALEGQQIENEDKAADAATKEMALSNPMEAM